MDERRTLIADAALAVIAGRGIRGLSHHAVDAEAGIAKGSTSYYCRRRVDLLALALRRLYDLDRTDLDALAADLGEGRRHASEIDDAVAALIVAWLSGERRARTIARFELFLAASHEPELQELLGEQVAAITAVADRIGRITQPPGNPLQPAARLLLAEGLMLAVVRQGLDAPSHAAVVGLLRAGD